KRYATGATFPSTDGCNTCGCGEGGLVACTAMACADTCNYDRQTWNVGDSFPAIDGCNTCSCLTGGQIACTDMACSDTCTYDRQTWNVGDTFPARDGCNTCTCQVGGQIACTEIACMCNEETEWWRYYYGHSAEECLHIRFACLEGNVAFYNDCGCGCEQSLDCSAFINCMSGSGVPSCGPACARCPFIPVAY
ncbi:MAG TPA: hypothetical protein PK141_27245, partial [Polyangiaceae bacterium]|nr:hypothetical protein [Polyangiaceae bacterium]